ncbi:solute carrier family 2, facilitated glucose transporter member 1-like isoform X2 [Babylonia areolata]
MGDEHHEKQSLRHSSSPARQGGVTGRLVLAVLLAVMGSFCFGYNTGVINAPEAMIKSFMNSTDVSRGGAGLSDSKLTSLFALIVAIFAVGGCGGGVCAGWWADCFGRKYGTALNAVIGIVAAALMFFSKMAGAYEMIIVGRLLVGFCCGIYTGVSPMYLSEISTPQIRGALGVLHQLGVVSGLLLSQALGFPEVLGNHSLWHVLLGVTVVPCGIQLVLFLLCPDSPRYLLITKKSEQQAWQALRVLRGTDDVQTDIDEMKAEAVQQDAEPKVSLLTLFTTRALRRPLMISVVMHLSQQLSGINGIFYYSASLFKGAGLDAAAATHATSGVGGVMVVMTLITIPLMDRAGRRTLHLIGLGGMLVFSILITVLLALRDEVQWFKVASIVVSLIFVVFFALGPGSIPWLIVAELFSQGPRSAAISVSVLVNWVANFLVGYTFPFIQKGLGNFTFLPFTGLLLLFLILLFLYLPETKGRTIEEIATGWRQQDGESNRSPVKESSHLVSYSKTSPA